MIKYLISFFIFFFIFSCKEINKNQVSLKINDSVKKIENIIDKQKKNKKNDNLKKTNNNNNVFYYIGEPYFIEGVKYIPEENYSYSEIGVSTFYGKELHNVKTINNDYNKVTELLGRHKTLPIPSMVKITNLDNGYSINIKIIDRLDDNTSLIQVSRKVAQLLGFYKDKIATVRVDILSDASKQWKNVSLSLNEPEFDKTISSAPTTLVSISNIDNSNLDSNYLESVDEPIEIETENVSQFNLYLKVFNFENYESLKTVMLDSKLKLEYTSEKNGSKYDIIIGPVDKNEINNLVSYFISKGYKETKIILN